MRFHFGWKSHFGVQSALYLCSHELRWNETQNGMDFISVILTEMKFQAGMRFSCEHDLPEMKWISVDSLDVAFNAHVRLKLSAGMNFILVILTQIKFKTGMGFSCEHDLPETKWISADSLDVAFDVHVNLKLNGFHIGHFDKNEISFRVIKYHVNTTRNEMLTHVHQNIGSFWNAAEMKLHVNRTCFHAGLKSQTGMSSFRSSCDVLSMASFSGGKNVRTTSFCFMSIHETETTLQKQSPGGLLRKWCSQKFSKITCVRFFFKQSSGFGHATLSKQRLWWHGCIPLNFLKYLST